MSLNVPSLNFGDLGKIPSIQITKTAATQVEIPLLTAEDIECRVQSVNKNKSGKVGAVLLLYKDARVDMRILDQVYGSGNWQRTHEVINGNLFCNIDIWDADKNTWVRKQDVGVESNTAKEKGEASDAFKRAGFNVGIGRELYTSPFTYIELHDDEYRTTGTDSFKCNSWTIFTVSNVAYNDRREICGLTIVDKSGTVRFSMGKPAQKPTPKPPQTPTREPQAPPPEAPPPDDLPFPFTDATPVKLEDVKLTILKTNAKNAGMTEEQLVFRTDKKYHKTIEYLTQDEYAETLNALKAKSAVPDSEK